MSYILAIDGGASKTRASLYDAKGNVLHSLSYGASNVRVNCAQACDILSKIVENIGKKYPISKTVCVVGVAGTESVQAKETYKTALSSVGFLKEALFSDGYLSLIAATQGKAGALVSLGTGVVAFELSQDRTVSRYDGWGFELGDHGGGAWLGRRLVQDYLRFLDSYEGFKNSSSTLWGRVCALVGDEQTVILDWIGKATPKAYASLAPFILNAFEEDPVARRVVFEAFSELERLIRTLESSEIFLSGGLARPYCQLLETYLREKGCLKTLVVSDRSPEFGGYLIGMDMVRSYRDIERE